MKFCFIFLPLLFGGACTIYQNSHIEYYSIEKSKHNISYGCIDNNFNFYKFQRYYKSIRVDSIYLEHYQYNFKDSVIYNFLLSKYIERGYDFSIKLLSQIGRLNADGFNDTAIIVLDINDSISLINLSPEFAIYALGTCCSHYQNLIIRKQNNSIIFSEVDDELIGGELLGIYAGEYGKIEGLLIQGYSNSNGAFNGLNSTYNVNYKITEKGIVAEELINVRNGEPFDKNDTIGRDLKDFGIKSVHF